jgi:uncharacterized protein (DUF362 family)
MIHSHLTPERGPLTSLIIVALCLSLGALAFVVAPPAAQAASTVSIVKTDHTPSNAEIDTMVRQAVALAGGLPVVSGDIVAVKPNWTEAGWPSGGGVVTNTQVLRTVVKMVLEAGGSPLIVEGSAGMHGSYAGWDVRAATKKAAYDVGVDTNKDMRDDYDYGTGPNKVPIVDLNDVTGTFPDYPCGSCTYPSSYVTPINVAMALYAKHNPYWVPNIIAPPPIGADVLISVPTLKNHGQAGYTAACKNRVGSVSNDIYHLSGSAWYKWNLVHAHGGTNEPADEYTAVDWSVADLNMTRPNDFAVVDGLVGITDGPTGGTPKSPNMRLIMASPDSVAIDTVGCLVIGYKPTSIAYLGYLATRGYGNTNPSQIDVVGSRVSQVRSDFPLPYADLLTGDRAESTPPTMTDFSPADGSTVSGTVSITPTGLTDNVAVAKVEIIIDGSVRSEVRSAPWTYSWNADAEGGGPHTVQVRAYDTSMNDFSLTHIVNVGATTVSSPLLSAGWHLISVPVEPSDPTPTVVFQDPSADPIPISGNLYRWDPVTRSYIAYITGDPNGFGDVTPGVGMWLDLAAPTQISYSGIPAAGPVDLTLSSLGEWHLIGQPHNGTTPLANCSVTDTDTPLTKTFADAISAQWLYTPLYCWDNTAGGYQRCGLTPFDAHSDLDAWSGYWLYVVPGRHLNLTVPRP